MTEIPIKPAWLVMATNSEGICETWESFPSQAEADSFANDLKKKLPDWTVEVHEVEDITPDRTMPTVKQYRELVLILECAFVAIRNIAYDEKSEIIAELADAFHNVPREMFDERNWDWNYLERSLERFKEKFPKATVLDFAGMISEIRSGVDSS